MKPGDKIRYLNYGKICLGEFVQFVGRNQLYIIKLEGPMAGSIAWIHKDSVVKI